MATVVSMVVVAGRPKSSPQTVGWIATDGQLKVPVIKSSAVAPPPPLLHGSFRISLQPGMSVGRCESLDPNLEAQQGQVAARRDRAVDQAYRARMLAVARCPSFSKKGRAARRQEVRSFVSLAGKPAPHQVASSSWMPARYHGYVFSIWVRPDSVAFPFIQSRMILEASKPNPTVARSRFRAGSPCRGRTPEVTGRPSLSRWPPWARLPRTRVDEQAERLSRFRRSSEAHRPAKARERADEGDCADRDQRAELRPDHVEARAPVED